MEPLATVPVELCAGVWPKIIPRCMLKLPKQVWPPPGQTSPRWCSCILWLVHTPQHCQGIPCWSICPWDAPVSKSTTKNIGLNTLNQADVSIRTTQCKCCNNGVDIKIPNVNAKVTEKMAKTLNFIVNTRKMFIMQWARLCKTLQNNAKCQISHISCFHHKGIFYRETNYIMF